MESEAYVSPILAFAAIAVVFAVLLVLFFGEMEQMAGLRRLVRRHARTGMLAIAWTATLGSLYYSEIVEFIPCEFCWYQRIAMYPLAVLLLLSLVTRSRLDARYIVALAAIGLPISIYHYQLQLFPEQGTVCTGIISCTDRNVEEYGFVSIPFMAGAGFLSILLLQLAVWRTERLGAGEPARS